MVGIFGEFFLVSVSHETKHENSSKNSGKFGAKFGAKFGTKIRKIRETFVLQVLQLTPPHTGSPGPFGPENPGRIRKESRKSTLGQGPKSPERVRPAVPKESEKSPKT